MRYQIKNGFEGATGAGPSRWQLPEWRPETGGGVESEGGDLRCLQRSLNGVCAGDEEEKVQREQWKAEWGFKILPVLCIIAEETKVLSCNSARL